MYAATSGSIQNQARERNVTLGYTISCMWQLLSVVSVYWILTWGCLDLWGAFFRSIQSCPPFFPQNGVCPVGSRYVNEGLCAPVPPGQEGWSGSRYCARKELVVAQGTALTGQVSLLMTLGIAFSNVFIGASLIDSLGRKPVIVMALAACCVWGFAYWCSCHMKSLGVMEAIIFGGTLLSKITDSCHASCTVMITDLARGDAQLQASGYSALNILRHVGILVAFAGGYPILLLELEDYTMVWAIYSIIALAAATYSAIILQETLSIRHPPATQPLRDADTEQARKPITTAGGAPADGSDGGTNSRLVDIMSEMSSAVLLVSRDPFLCGMMVTSFVSSAATYGSITISSGYQLDAVRLSQAHASLSGILQPTAIVAGSSLAPRLFNRVGAWKTFWLALLVCFLSLFITAAGARFRDFVRPCFWGGWTLLGIGFGLLEPAYSTILGQYTDKKVLGKVFSVKEFMNNVGTGLGSYIWSNYIFAPHPGWSEGLGFLISAAMYMCLVFFTGGLYRAYIRKGCGQGDQ